MFKMIRGVRYTQSNIVFYCFRSSIFTNRIVILKTFLFFFLIYCCGLLSLNNVYAAQVTLEWDPNTESDLAGYRVYYGTASRSYSNSTDVGNKTIHRISDLNDGTTYYFAVTAYDSSDNESSYSAELVYSDGSQNNAPNTPNRPTGPSSGKTQSTYNFRTSAIDPDGDTLVYRFNWGDGQISDWSSSSRSHSWSSPGNFCVRAQARDELDVLSSWSACHTISIGGQNSAPYTPSAPSGPSTGFTNTTYSFNASATDPDGDTVEYRFDWGDGKNSDWGSSLRSHAWTSNGSFCVRAQAKDELDALSNWSSCRNFNIVSNRDSARHVSIWLEGENAIIGAPMVIESDFSASGNKYIHVPNGNWDEWSPRQYGGYAEYTFQIPEAGDYVIWGRVIAGNNRDDSFFVSTDGNNFALWDVQISNTWIWDQVNDRGGADPFVFHLAAGQNTLIIDQRETGTKLDRILITNDLEYLPTEIADSMPPLAPLIFAPANNELVSLTPELLLEDFYDPDSDDTHWKTQWQIFDEYRQICVFDIETTSSLLSVTVPKLILEENTTYYWQARFIDNHGVASSWSESELFITDFNSDDMDGNGLLDFQELEYPTDMDGDGILDSEQNDIKCVKSEGESKHIGISSKGFASVLAIDSLITEDASGVLERSNSSEKPAFLPFGLVSFRLILSEPGEEAQVKVYLSEQVPKDSKWFKYDAVEDNWHDYSEYAQLSPDGQSITLTIVDGGLGDADGTENGIIIDPSGIGIGSGGAASTSLSSGDSASGSGGGCFITIANSASFQPANNISFIIHFIALLSILVTAFVGLGLKKRLNCLQQYMIG